MHSVEVHTEDLYSFKDINKVPKHAARWVGSGCNGVMGASPIRASRLKTTKGVEDTRKTKRKSNGMWTRGKGRTKEDEEDWWGEEGRRYEENTTLYKEENKRTKEERMEK